MCSPGLPVNNVSRLKLSVKVIGDCRLNINEGEGGPSHNLYLELVNVLLLDVLKEEVDRFRCKAEKMTERNLKSCNGG